MGREDPRCLSGHEPPVEQKKEKALENKHICRGEAHFLSHTGLPIFKQAQREMENLLQSEEAVSGALRAAICCKHPFTSQRDGC